MDNYQGMESYEPSADELINVLKNLENLAAASPALYRAIVDQINGKLTIFFPTKSSKNIYYNSWFWVCFTAVKILSFLFCQWFTAKPRNKILLVREQYRMKSHFLITFCHIVRVTLQYIIVHTVSKVIFLFKNWILTKSRKSSNLNLCAKIHYCSWILDFKRYQILEL